MMKLRIAKELALPLDAVTRTMVVYGGRGMGKTNLGTVLCEELSRAGQRFSYIDPMGHLWGLRHSTDGKGPGIEVLILGGRYGDIPIEPTSGVVVADLVADEETDVIVDISRRTDGKTWSKGERIRFVTDYCKRLYERQGERMRPIMQIIDEAARFIPQMARHGDDQVAACIGAVEQMVEEGRGVGIGVTLITQRSARLSKSVAELAEAMIAFRTIGPNSVDAILDWFGEHIPKEHWKGLVEKLRSLPRGDALVVSPGWLAYEGVAHIRERTTFDSSATPKAGQERHARGAGAKPDLGRYLERMKETIEKAQSTDPKRLQRRISELERELQKGPRNIPGNIPSEKPPKIERIEVPVLKDAQIKRLEAVADRAIQGIDMLQQIADGVRLDLRNARANQPVPRPTDGDQPRPPGSPGRIYPGTGAAWAPPPRVASSFVREKSAIAPPNGDISVGNSGLRRMLIALAQRSQGLTNAQLGVRAGVSSRSGTFATYLARARSQGWISGRGTLQVTESGLVALGSYDPLPEGPALAAYWIRLLGGGASRMLRALVDSYPASITNEELGQRAGISDRSGTFATYLARLRTLELVTGRGELRASEELF